MPHTRGGAYWLKLICSHIGYHVAVHNTYYDESMREVVLVL